MICAIVDLGSNTIRLCVYEYDNNIVTPMFSKKTMAGLINYISDQSLSRQGIDKACSILEEYRSILNHFHVEESNVHVFATASLRNIINTEEAIQIISETTGYRIELLSGEEEATLDFIGATKTIDIHDGLLLDIGGGSTELVVFQNKEVRFATSIPIGSLNLYVKHVEKIIPKKEERKNIKQEVINYLDTLNLETEVFKTICGVGGTVRAASKLNNSIYNLPISNSAIEVSHIKEMLKSMKNSHRVSLTTVLQNIPDRIHTIIPGMIILNTIAEYFCSEEIIVSNSGIREGYLYERVIKGE